MCIYTAPDRANAAFTCYRNYRKYELPSRKLDMNCLREALYGQFPTRKLEKFQFSRSFLPVLTCISMETCCRCRARWRVAAAAHNIRVLIGQIVCQSALCERSIA